MLNKYIFDNPELIRNIRTSFRYPRYASLTIIYFLMLFSIYFIIYLSRSTMNYADYANILYTITFGIEYLAWFYIGSYFVSNSMVQEKEKGTFDFLRLTVIDRKVLTFGKLFGAVSFIGYIILLTFPLVTLEAYIAGISPLSFIMSHLNLVLYGLLFHTVALFSAISLGKSSSSNTVALGFPMFVLFISLIFNTRTTNPFYILFSNLISKEYTIHKLNFYLVNLPDFAIVGIIIFYIIYWLVNGLIRKFESESNHVLTKKQALYSLIGSEIILLGLFMEKIITGSTFIVNVFFIINLLLQILYISFLTPNKDDLMVHLNRKEKNENLFNSKGPVFSLLILFNIVITLFGTGGSLIAHVFNHISLGNTFFTLLLGLITASFAIIYSQVFYLSNIIFSKNAPLFTMLIIIVSMFIPLPINFFTSTNAEFTSVFLLNPFITIMNLDLLDYFKLSTITEIIILLIVILMMNVLIISKNEELNKKYKITD